LATIQGFRDNINESYAKYGTSTSYEIISVHGYNRQQSSYIVSLFWQEYAHVDTAKITWAREGASVAGYTVIDNVSQKVCERINGNAKREATCFKEYKDLTKYTHSASIKLPLPDPWTFNKQDILAEINLKEQSHARPILFSE
jgi:hypothetical protein